MTGNLPSFLEGGPEGYNAWQIGDESHCRLTAYHEGQDVELNDWELDFLKAFTHPDFKGVYVYEDWRTLRESGAQGEKGTLNFYIPESQRENRWNIGRKQKITEDDARVLGVLGLTSDQLFG